MVTKKNKKWISEDYKIYVIKEKLKEFKKMCRQNSLDFYSCGCVLTAHLCMHELMRHKLPYTLNKTKANPKEAWDKAMKQTPFHSGTSAEFARHIVEEFSIRNKEFKEWNNNPKKMETLYELEKEKCE